MSGSNGKLPTDPRIASAMRGLPPPNTQQVQVVEAVRQFMAMSGPDMMTMMPTEVACLCGKCQGVGVQFEVRFHFNRLGMVEIIRRGDAAPTHTPPVEEKPQ
jgi:hypothetical protein